MAQMLLSPFNLNRSSMTLPTPPPSPSRERLVCVGNGLVGHRAIRDLLSRAPERFDVTIFGEEPHDCYDRIRLSAVLSGELALTDLSVANRAWYQSRRIELRTGVRITRIDRTRKTVTDDEGRVTPYDHLLLCTGSSARILAIPGVELNGVVTFRNLHDVDSMIQASQGSNRRAIVIGGGLLGLEAAAGLRKRGMDVTVLQLPHQLMERQLDGDAAELLRRFFVKLGAAVRLNAETTAIVGDETGVRAVRLSTGEELPADLVVMAVGIVPRIELAKSAGLLCGSGIIVNDRLRTSDPSISALGECAEHRGHVYGLVAPLYEMARVWAEEIVRPYSVGYAGTEASARLKVGGVDVFSAGQIEPGPATEVVTFRDTARGHCKTLLVDGNRLRGAILYGNATDGAWYARMIRERMDIADLRDVLIHGQAFADAMRKDSTVVSVPLSDEAEICGCNGVCKKEIVQAIWTHRLTSLAEIRHQTKASASCGSCTKLVEQILVETRGKEAKTTSKAPPVCHCTELSHDEVRTAVPEQNLKTIAAVMQALEWKTPDGCHVCRPALNYYLLCAWPTEYEDHTPSRVVNERLHANIQRDGTYSVVPRMWGGLTSPDELRAIAYVAEKFAVPTVKITGGQRIDLLGVRKEDLPAVWSDLGRAGFVSGHAYGKAVRTVKTCVGSEWCRFGTQDSTAMGIAIEKACWGAWTPHKVKMAVSGCPRNCAESGVKDFGVVAVESGWELYVGGNGGTKVRVADLLCKVTTADEVLEHTMAFMQFYRENARYLERTSTWVDRVGLDAIRNKIVDDPAGRQSLARKFQASQEVAQVDPWAQISSAESEDDVSSYSTTTGSKIRQHLPVITGSPSEGAGP